MAEQEPGGWELLRAIKSIDARLDNFAQNYVPLAVFATLVDRVKDTEEDLDAERAVREKFIADEKHSRENAYAALRKEIDDQRKAKAQQWFGIGLLAVGGVISLLVEVFKGGLGV